MMMMMFIALFTLILLKQVFFLQLKICEQLQKRDASYILKETVNHHCIDALDAHLVHSFC